MSNPKSARLRCDGTTKGRYAQAPFRAANLDIRNCIEYDKPDFSSPFWLLFGASARSTVAIVETKGRDIMLHGRMRVLVRVAAWRDPSFPARGDAPKEEKRLEWLEKSDRASLSIMLMCK